MLSYNFEKLKKSVKFNAERHEYGVKEEHKLLVPLQKNFKDDSITPLPEGSVFDFKGDGKFIELKSRTFHKKRYPTTCVSANKIHYAREHCHRYDFYFVFNFTDGVWCWKYNKQQPLSEFVISGILHYFIPIDDLTPLCINKV